MQLNEGSADYGNIEYLGLETMLTHNVSSVGYVIVLLLVWHPCPQHFRRLFLPFSFTVFSHYVVYQ